MAERRDDSASSPRSVLRFSRSKDTSPRRCRSGCKCGGGIPASVGVLAGGIGKPSGSPHGGTQRLLDPDAVVRGAVLYESRSLPLEPSRVSGRSRPSALASLFQTGMALHDRVRAAGLRECKRRYLVGRLVVRWAAFRRLFPVLRGGSRGALRLAASASHHPNSREEA